MQPKNNTSAIERVDALIAHIEISQAAFARRCGVEPSNLNKRLSGEVKFTDNYFAKIALCLGHSWADVTDHYIAYGTKRIDDAVRKIIDYVNSDKT